MKFKLTKEEYENIQRLALSAADASTKNSAQPYLVELNFICHSGKYGGGARNILSEVYCDASNSAGRVANKSHRESCLHRSLYKLESFYVENVFESTDPDQ